MARIKDISGQRFGRLVVVHDSMERADSNKSVIWVCRCDCGNISKISSSQLKKGRTNSCGCLRAEIARVKLKKSILSRKKFKNKNERLDFYRKNLTDDYIKGLITSKWNIKRKDIPDEILDIKRLQIKILRELKDEKYQAA